MCTDGGKKTVMGRKILSGKTRLFVLKKTKNYFQSDFSWIQQKKKRLTKMYLVYNTFFLNIFSN